DIRFHGYGPGNGHSQLAGSSSVTLAGTLNLIWSGFTPVPGDSFDPLVTTAPNGVSGTFATINGLNPAPGVQLVADYQADRLRLNAISTRPTITAIANVDFLPTDASKTVNFTVGDPDTDVSLLTVTAA